MLGDAVKSKLDTLRSRDDNPGAVVPGPDRWKKTAKQWVNPSVLISTSDVDEQADSTRCRDRASDVDF